MKDLELAVRALPGIVFWKDKDGVYQFVNRNFLAFIGRTENEVLSKRDVDLFPEEMANHFRGVDQQVMESGKTLSSFQEQVLDASGSMVSVQVSKSPIFNEHGEVIGIVGIGMPD